jgi:HEAT repeat protein
MDDQDTPQSTVSGTPDSGNRSAGQEIPDQTPPDTSPDQNERLAHFIELLTDDNEGTRWKAAEVLGRIGDPAAVEALIDTLWDDDSRVRLKAAWALGQIGDQRALHPLQRLYRMENEGAQEIIAEALEEIKRQMSMQ